MRLQNRIPIAATLLLPLLLAAPAHAVLANRVFMSTTGNDSNNCANPNTPCLTFAGSLAQVAVGGEVIAEATGGYGAINITQGVTVSGPPGVVIYSGFTVTVNAPAATVVLRGLTIDGTGTTTGSGINVLSVGNLHVENCVITGFAGNPGSDGTGIFFNSDSAGRLFVKDTIIRGNGYIGIWVNPSSGTAQASVDHCRLEGNFFGLVSENNVKATIRDSVVSGHTASGLQAETGGELNAEGCLVANNVYGLVSVEAGSILRVSNCTVTDNDTGLFADVTSSLLTRSNNTVEGNGTDGSFTGTYSAK